MELYRFCEGGETMSLISGADLKTADFFKSGTPKAQGSSFDLSIGRIFGQDGQEISGPFTLKPGHMVQVVSAEVFNLPATVTGHVTYKTGLTRKGIWALTVGIVDPGWDGPVGTTLLNFSRIDHTIHPGDKFLRVSLFSHHPVSNPRKAPDFPEYLKEIQSLAASSFPATFLNSDQIVHDAGKAVMSRIRNEGLAWLGLLALFFALIQIFAPPAARWIDHKLSPTSETEMRAQIEQLKTRIDFLETAPEASTGPGDNAGTGSAEPVQDAAGN